MCPLALPFSNNRLPSKPNGSSLFVKSKFHLSSTPHGARGDKRFWRCQIAMKSSVPRKGFEYLRLCDHEENLKRLKSTLRSLSGYSHHETLLMIDAIQRLCLQHHFEAEIDEILNQFHSTICSKNLHGWELEEVGLSFRMLRQRGHYVPQSVFNIFKRRDGKFKEGISNDIKGLMELYEASHVCIEGEDALDDARDFSAKGLEACLLCVGNNQSRQIRNTLDHPHHKTLERFRSNFFLKENRQTRKYWWMEHLVDAAKIDFDVSSSIHSREKSQLSSWWAKLGIAKEACFVRYQVSTWHMFSTILLTNPMLSNERQDITKAISFVYVIDDIFDNHAILEDLVLFTRSIERWDHKGIKRLPPYIQSCFKALDEFTSEFSLKIHQKHGTNPIVPLRRSWANLCNAFLVEARWFASGYMVGCDEYMCNGIITTGLHVPFTYLSFSLGQPIDSKNEDRLVCGASQIVSSASGILRLWDDFQMTKDDDEKKGHDASFLDCYVNEHKGSCYEDAKHAAQREILSFWKKLNKEVIVDESFSRQLKTSCLNVARVVPLIYGGLGTNEA